MTIDEAQKRIMLIDGWCDLCSKIVQFTIKHDPQQKILFASLQSEAGQKILRQHHLPASDFKSFVWIENDRAYLKSTGALKYFKMLNGCWPLLTIFIIIPKPLRDFFYDFVSARRYRWFGKRDVCLAPTPELKDRFLI